ncbi:PLP-dependent aminotransferase family protein (plasmid) [Thioclava litoralis]|uniref:PLP-dependent aminotransferase family protein n=1 Tax=Thioclava litoralis TaxID=3076557 RepID=A0ABZ1E6Q7_9RHOB|nr:PLP-dependent aminotransferase family protein [Thioclava sp. FTW29]
MTDWTPKPNDSGKPHYLAIADAIGADIAAGRLKAGDRLPPQRRLAAALGIDFTTVSRAYTEAQARGLVTSHVGRGSFVSDPPAALPAAPLADPARRAAEDLSMNMPPEPTDPDLLAGMRAGLMAVSGHLVDLLRYQSPIGTEPDRLAARSWLAPRGLDVALERIAVTPGAHATMAAVLSMLCKAGDHVLCEQVTYPGIRNIAARFGVTLVGLQTDARGVVPEALQAAIRRHRPKALYLNPTLHNPTTLTLPAERRAALAAILRAEGLALIEDDAYGFVPAETPAPLAQQIPELTWYIGGLSKCLGAGLRLAFTVTPDARATHRLTQAIRALSVMPAPLSLALTTRWIEQGTAEALRQALRNETAARQAIARRALEGCDYATATSAFHIWLQLPQGLGRADVIARMAGQPLGLMPSDAFTVGAVPQDRLRVSLGGSISRAQLQTALCHLGHALSAQGYMG